VCMELRDTIGAAPLKITPIPFMRFPKLVLRTLGVCYGLLMWNGMINRIRSALSVPQAYQLFWHAVAGPRYIRTLVEEHIRPTTACRILDIGCEPGTAVPYLGVCEYEDLLEAPPVLPGVRLSSKLLRGGYCG